MSSNGEKEEKKKDLDYEDVDVTTKKPISHIPVKQNKRSTRRNNERESVCSKNDQNKFKSILKKPSATFNDTESVGTVIEPSAKTASYKSGSHFYLPMPNANRKKVQFLVENELSTNQNAPEITEEEKPQPQVNGKDENESPTTDTDTG